MASTKNPYLTLYVLGTPGELLSKHSVFRETFLADIPKTSEVEEANGKGLFFPEVHHLALHAIFDSEPNFGTDGLIALGHRLNQAFFTPIVLIHEHGNDALELIVVLAENRHHRVVSNRINPASNSSLALNGGVIHTFLLSPSLQSFLDPGLANLVASAHAERLRPGRTLLLRNVLVSDPTKPEQKRHLHAAFSCENAPRP